MNIAAFVASSSHTGNTATAVAKLLEGAVAQGAQTRAYYLNDHHIKPCTGCRVCEKTHVCTQKGDGVATLHEGIRWADAYVLGTPTYYGDITGQFKQFVDRCYPFIDIYKNPETREMRFGSIIPVRKPGVLVAVSGGHGGSGVFDSHTKVAFHCLNDINGYLWRELLIPHTTWTPVRDMPEQLETLYATGEALVHHLRTEEGEDVERSRAFRAKF